MPSIWWENSPLTIHEAFLAGVPVVASRLGGHVEELASTRPEVKSMRVHAAELVRFYEKLC